MRTKTTTTAAVLIGALVVLPDLASARTGEAAAQADGGRASAAASGVFAQRDGTPGNPPSTVTGRAVDRAQGQTPQPDGTPGNPPGTAAGRAVDRTLGANPGGTGPSR